MSLRWAWDWGLGLSYEFYNDSTEWGITGGGVDVFTDNITNLAAPSGPGTPGEQYNCRIKNYSPSGQVFTPVFPGASVTQGWFVGRYRIVGQLSNSSQSNVIQLREADSTVRVHLRGSLAGTPVPLELFVNGTSVGTSVRLVGDASSYVLAVDFDMAAVPPEGGLVIDGVREIALSPGSGTATAIARASLGSGGFGTSVSGYWGLLLLFDSLADTRGMNPNYWGTGLNANAVSNDANWSIFGGAASKVAAISDRNSATGLETTTDPDSITVGFELTTDILAGWLPSTILMVVGVGIGTADVLNNTTLDLSDGTGTAGTGTDLLTATQNMVMAYAELNSVATAWTAGQVNAATYDWDISS